VRPPLRRARDAHGRLWVCGQTDQWAIEKLRREMARDGVQVLPHPRAVLAGPIALSGERHQGEVFAQEHRGEAGWRGLVRLEREYIEGAGQQPGWWHLVVLWLPADRIEVIDRPLAPYVAEAWATASSDK
jgi:hypothetical protein